MQDFVLNVSGLLSVDNFLIHMGFVGIATMWILYMQITEAKQNGEMIAI